MSTEKTSDANRRQSVRVSDRALFACGKLLPDEYKEILDDYSRGILPRRHKGIADIEMFIGAQSALSRLREKDEDLADFLQHMDAKISQVLKNVTNMPSPLDELQLQEINISGAGIGFDTETSYALNDIVECSLVLLPNYSYIHCIGKVVSCEEMKKEDKAKKYRVALEFTLLIEEDRERIIQHSFKLQSVALRSRRLENY
ncbi:MAG: PilZ domain-containing protein [Proteobacteria bacterium]|nr:PilZ domain-containing protein [Pseudomonadota bacterium]MBU1710552.1 PilZ domain-containing protein [Pseudomonadota bacterium]